MTESPSGVKVTRPDRCTTIDYLMSDETVYKRGTIMYNQPKPKSVNSNWMNIMDDHGDQISINLDQLVHWKEYHEPQSLNEENPFLT